MWFLHADTFIGILLICFLMLILNRIRVLSVNVRLILLAVLSVVFVGWVSLKLLLFYLLYVSVIFCIARVLQRMKRARRIVFIAGVLLCILPLLYVRLWPYRQIEVIIGLAFALLRGIDSLFYVYYTEEKLQPMTFINYMMFIPTFTAGPLFRYRDFLKATRELLTVSIVDFVEATKRIIRGLFKTIVLGQVIMQVFWHFIETDSYTLPVSILLVVCSYLNLYFNLSGYADIAIGLGMLCGFIVPENFKKPWFSASFTMFWRSWHATVSDWIREHVQLVLHSKKMTKAKAALTSMVVMTTMSMWHGFSVQFLMLSLFPGALLAIENLFKLTSPKRKWTAVRVLRCLAVSFLFGINSLLFTIEVGNVAEIMLGFFRIAA